MNSSHLITFGTSGYRGIVGDTFLDTHVRSIVDAIGQYLISNGRLSVVIGYDPRPGNSLDADGFPMVAADILSRMGIDVVLASTPVPTPLISWYVKTHDVGGGIIFTASHNPPNYNGIKFNPPPGGPATSDVTQTIESLIREIPEYVSTPKSVTQVSLVGAFARFISNYVTTLHGTGEMVSIVADCRHGTGGAVWTQLMQGNQDIRLLKLLHREPKSDFGGIEPNPTMPVAFGQLSQVVVSCSAALGVAHDPDADRHVICDENGVFVSPEMVASIVLNDWVSRGIEVDGVVSTVASSGLIRTVCRALNKQYWETPVGFKYFTPHFQSAETRVIGVESSGGFSVSDYLFEKCGFLPVILISKICAQRNMKLSELVLEISKISGRFVFIEDQFNFAPSRRVELVTAISHLDGFSGLDAPVSTIAIDGKKWIWADGSWVLIRLSGTEPLGRIYAEGPTTEVATRLKDLAVEWAVFFK